MSEMFESFARLKRVTTLEDARLAETVARCDDHNAIAPSHLVIKENNVVGHFSVGSIPLWVGHLKKGVITPHDTFRLLHAVECILEDKGAMAVQTLVGRESGLHKHMAELGYRFIGNADVFIKSL